MPLSFLSHVLRHPYALLPGAPRGIINSAKEWIDAQRVNEPADIRRGPPAAYWDIDPSAMLTLPPPHTVETSGEARCLRIFPVPETSLFFLKNARVLGSGATVISADNQVFAEFTYADDSGGIDSHSIFRRRRFPKVQPLKGWYATICYPSDTAYYHWVIETLPRLRMLEPYLQQLDGLFVPSDLEPAMRESLRVFGLRDEQLIPIDYRSHFAPEHLLVPKFCTGLDIPLWVSQYLRAKTLSDDDSMPSPQRIYISRADAAKRRIVNEVELLPMLLERGFEVIRLREHSFIAQARLFARADFIVSPHGAGLANAAFCHAGAKVLELIPSPEISPHAFYSVTSSAQGEYWFMHGDQRGLPKRNAIPLHSDFKVDPEMLERSLDAMGALA